MMTLRQWFKDPAPRPERRGVRHPAPRFEVIYPAGSELKAEEIKDISATGVYLFTSDRLEPGTTMAVTLHRKSFFGSDGDSDFTLQSKVVRQGKDGVALSFELPKDIDPRAWVSLVEGASGEAGPDELVGHFKMARAVAFLSRICPDAERDFRRRFCTDLSSGRFKHAIEIALKAENIMAGWRDSENMHANPKLLAGILEYGSWAEEDSIQQSWAGMMALACTPEKDEEAGLDLVERVSQFATIHFKLFGIACERATKVYADGVVSSRPLKYTPDEILRIGGSRDLGRIERELQHLHDLGLFMSDKVPSSYIPTDMIDMAPTPLGLELNARFHAHRGSVESYYGLGVAAEGVLARA